MILANGHGGARPGSGRPKKKLADKILEGTTKQHKPKVIKFDSDEVPVIEKPAWIDYYGSKTAGAPDAPEIFDRTVEWLKTTGCLHLINPDFIMDYAIIKASWFEAQRRITHLGLVYTYDGKKLDSNPHIDVAMKYYKMSEMAWDKIWRIVVQNCEENFGGVDSQTALMEKLLKMNMEA